MEIQGILDSVQTNYPAINNAAGEFLTKLALTGLNKDLAIAAEMAGLMMLRASSADFSKIPAGTNILGAIPDDKLLALHRFVLVFALSNKFNPKDLDFDAIPSDAKSYLPELTRFERPFYDVCEKHGIAKEFFPFTAAAAAGKLALAGNQLGLLKAKVGFAMVLFHIAAGTKTVPYPASDQRSA